VSPPTAQSTVGVGTDGQEQIVISQISQNQAGNTSQVQVTGLLKNVGGSGVSHTTRDITATITGNDSFTGPDFSYTLQPGDSVIFIDHTFTVTHTSDGTKAVTYHVEYGDTGHDYLGSNQTATQSLTLTRIPKPPIRPGSPAFDNETPTTISVSWSGSPDDQGSVLNGYLLRRYEGQTATGDYVDNFGDSLTRNVTGLIPGAFYTFTTYAQNNAANNNGYSAASDPSTIQMVGGAYIRVGNKWKVAVSYVRADGVWKVAIPYVRNGGTWKLTI
jgi:hypothetical protein